MVDMGGQLHFQADWDDAINHYKDQSTDLVILFVVSLEDYRYKTCENHEHCSR
jgi:hypothetical protein